MSICDHSDLDTRFCAHCQRCEDGSQRVESIQWDQNYTPVVSGRQIGPQQPDDDLASIAAWLQSRLNDIAKRDDAGDISEGIIRASLHARAVIFAKPALKEFIGPCEGAIIEYDDGEPVEVECVGEIFLAEGANVAECDQCLRAYDPDAAIRARDDALVDYLFTPYEIAKLAHRTFGKPEERVRSLIRSWTREDRNHSPRLIAHGISTETGAPTYRYGDVRDMLVEVYGDVG